MQFTLLGKRSVLWYAHIGDGGLGTRQDKRQYKRYDIHAMGDLQDCLLFFDVAVFADIPYDAWPCNSISKLHSTAAENDQV